MLQTASRAHSFLELPFSLSPDPRYLYISSQHKNAIAKTLYMIENRQGLAVVFGDVGLGKTTMGRRLYEIFRQNDDQIAVAYIPNPAFPSEHQLLKGICREFGIKPALSKLAQLDLFNEFLIAQWQAGRNVVLLIDEAQALIGKQFELLRQLLNYESDSQKLLQIVLLGQNELRQKLKLKRALSSRIAARSTLEPLDFTDTRDMIEFRLRVAGRSTPLFTEEAYRIIYDETQGVPRAINLLCLNIVALIGNPEGTVDLELVRAAAQEAFHG